MAGFVTGEVARGRVRVLLDRIDAAQDELRELSTDEAGTAFRVQMAERLETQQRVNRGLMYRVFAELANPPDETGPDPDVIDKLWARLRIAPKELKRRFKVAARIRPRAALTGAPLPPELPAVADAVEAGAIGEDHLHVITHCMDGLPSNVSVADRTEVEESLVREAAKTDAEAVRIVGRRIDEIFNPDGHYDETDRARRRGLVLGRQGRDGMSRLSGWIDPETRCYVETATAAVRPGRHLPDGSVAETPDDRSMSQRCHDGIKLGLKAGIASGELGKHRGHAVTVIVRTTLAELNQAAHAAVDPNVWMPAPASTGGNTALPMRDVIRMATDAIHYLAVFDDHTERPLYLGRKKRIATVDQRIICYARDGGCTRPGCTEPGYHCEVHHCPDWADGGVTDADMLFFACGRDHTAVSEGRWRTSVTETGRLAWHNDSHPPEVNRLHHPEELLRGNTDPPDEDC
ncbi:HNH endonuclease signature motif containing protein [Mycobacterium sp. E740]|uniref:HNH endonuclease signature motif containing protein n=1 Tax=Mycobacterium sp. E740 TaxID=1834149 RepID=UPI0007FF74A4|nr:HNH endonuclease signature motif containing protein [Mycobacterium sp. E740]OBI74325.1 HNH nuclease [Mycobacterium sp. E740]